jgi:hypothetical protein
MTAPCLKTINLVSRDESFSHTAPLLHFFFCLKAVSLIVINEVCVWTIDGTILTWENWIIVLGGEPSSVPLHPQEVSHKKSCGIEPGPSGAKCIASVQEVVSAVEVSGVECARYVIVTDRRILDRHKEVNFRLLSFTGGVGSACPYLQIDASFIQINSLVLSTI